MSNKILFLRTPKENSVVYPNDLHCWEQLSVVKMHYAFSNDQNYPRRYVQGVVHAVQSSSTSRVFVCSRAAMACRFRDIFEPDKLRRGVAWFDAIHKSGRFAKDDWTKDAR